MHQQIISFSPEFYTNSILVSFFEPVCFGNKENVILAH